MGRYYGEVAEGEKTASYKGVALKTLFLMGLAILAAVAACVLLFTFPGIALAVMIVAIGVTFICAIVNIFAPRAVKVTGPLYAFFEGFMIGAISAVVGIEYGGIVFAALLATFVTLAVMMILYYTGIFKVTHKFRSAMFAALISMVLLNLVVYLLSLFIAPVKEFFYGTGWFAIGISVVMTIIAAFYLLIDLDNITQAVERGLEKDAEWYAAFGLTVTLMWLYLQFLRLFLILASRKK